MDELTRKWLPLGWNLVNASHETFLRQDERWKLVQGKADLVMTQVPADQHNDEWIKQMVNHCGMAMKLTGVCHMFCTHIQYAKIHAAACDRGMEMMPFPMLYVWDSKKRRNERRLSILKKTVNVQLFSGEAQGRAPNTIFRRRETTPIILHLLGRTV